jgi:hypothetical protein
MNGEMKCFLQDGVSLYGEARDTLAAFERGLGRVLEAALQKRKRWNPLKKTRIGSPGQEGSNEADGWWVGSYITGSWRRGEVKIDCWFWWNAPNVSEPILYARFYDTGTPSQRTFSWLAREKNGISSFDRWRSTCLYVPVPKSVEIEAPMNHLLDALLKQLI